MKASIVLPLAALLATLGCASGPPLPEGMKVDQFVSFQCEGGKRFSARVAEGGQSIRVRADGGYELDHKADGVYEGQGFRLVTSAGTANLFHDGKQTHKGCKPAA
jgi:hypothetical protein